MPEPRTLAALAAVLHAGRGGFTCETHHRAKGERAYSMACELSAAAILAALPADFWAEARDEGRELERGLRLMSGPPEGGAVSYDDVQRGTEAVEKHLVAEARAQGAAEERARLADEVSMLPVFAIPTGDYVDVGAVLDLLADEP